MVRELRSQSAARLIWLLSDQAIYAGGNFLTNILFARWLSIRDYGLYSLSFSGFLFFSVLHYGAFLEPLLIHSALVDLRHRRSYVVAMIQAHSAMLAVSSCLGIICFEILASLEMADAAWAVFGAVAGGTPILVLLTARRLCLVFLTALTSAAIGALYVLGVLATAYEFHQSGGIFWGDLWLIIGAWSLLCSVIVFYLLYRNAPGTEPYSLLEVYRFQRRYFGWSVLSSVGGWLRFESILFLLARLDGLEAVAQTRAIVNLGSPLDQILNVIQSISLVQFGAAHREGRREPISGMLTVYSLSVCMLIAGLWIFAPPLVSMFYAGRYVEQAWQLPVYYLALGCLGVEHIISSVFKSRGLMTKGYLPQVGTALIGISAGAVFIPAFGQPGAMYSILMMYAAGAVTVLAFMWRQSSSRLRV
jgi:O-antigen/teichoic acid export membrane protein